jgi:hypothetical protein
VTLDEARARARDEIARLPAAVRGLGPAAPPYPVRLSAALESLWEEVGRGYSVFAS